MFFPIKPPFIGDFWLDGATWFPFFHLGNSVAGPVWGGMLVPMADGAGVSESSKLMTGLVTGDLDQSQKKQQTWYGDKQQKWH